MLFRSPTLFGIDVHRALGPGLLESAYEECLCYELSQAGIGFTRQRHLPVAYKNVKLDCGYRMDVVVDESVIVEVKTVERLAAIHDAQILSYLNERDAGRPSHELPCSRSQKRTQTYSQQLLIELCVSASRR